MKKQILPILLLSVVMPMAAQQTQHVHGGNNQDAGITYTLPKTAMHVTVSAKCTTFKAGALAQFAEKYLGISDASQDNAVTWEVTGVEVQPYALPDTSKTFHVSTAVAAQMPNIRLSDEGMLWCVNYDPEAPISIEEPAPAVVPAKKELHAVSVMNEEMLRAASKNKQAEIAARQIFRIRESRLNLLTGDVDNLPADGASFQLVLDNLEAQEKAYLELFTGTQSTTTQQLSFDYEFGTHSTDSIVFRFSRHYGFVDADDLTGEPYRMVIEVMEDNTEVPVLKDAKGKVRPAATGLAYNIPGKARYSIVCRKQALATGVVTVAQLGHVERLSPTQFTDKKAPASATFDLFTGNIKIYE